MTHVRLMILDFSTTATNQSLNRGNLFPHCCVGNFEMIAETGEGITAAREVGKEDLSFLAGLAVIVLGLGLRLGLGLGLRNRGDSDTDTLQSTKPPISWQGDPQEYVLSSSFDTKAEKTTEEYTFNLTEIINGAPDGAFPLLQLVIEVQIIWTARME